MAGIAAASGSGPFGNAVNGIRQAAQAAKERNAAAGNVGQAAQGIQEGASGGGDLEGRVAALEGQAGSAGGGEVAGVAGMTGADLLKSRSMFGDMSSRQQSVGRGLGSGLGKFFGY
jgi:hypothetical protein